MNEPARHGTATPEADDTALLAEAEAATVAAAMSAGVEIRLLDRLEEFHAAVALVDAVWQPAVPGTLVSPESLRALTTSGNPVTGAFHGNRMVGTTIAWFGPPASRTVHSHITGVAADYRARSLGFALKVHQRALALAHGVATVTWTFDPLIRRNAYFNLVKLAATAVRYLPDFYGPVEDGVAGRDPTDRLYVRWPLGDPSVIAACSGRRPDQHLREQAPSLALSVGTDGRPQQHGCRARLLTVAVPEDIEGMRAEDPEVATAWRFAVREVLTELLADGAVITGFDPERGYVLDRLGTFERRSATTDGAVER